MGGFAKGERMKLSTTQIKKLKSALTKYAATKGGTVARITYHRQNRYVRGFVCQYCTDRRIGEIRVYATGNAYTLTVPQTQKASDVQTVVDHDVLESADFES